jgi:3-oxosteroid 1-dehydrogenase
MGGYDHDQERARFLEQRPDYQSALPLGADGAHLVIAGEIGADVATVPPVNACAILGYHMPGEEHEGQPLWRPSFEAGLPHMIAVNRKGKRFGDESFYRDYQPRVTAWDGLAQRFENLPAFLVFDQSYRDRYPIASIPPGQPLPDGFAEQADSVGVGVNAAGLRIDADARVRHVRGHPSPACTPPTEPPPTWTSAPATRAASPTRAA